MEFRKRCKLIVAIVVTLAMSCSFFACGKVSGTIVDANKTQIYMRVYNGGSGTDWIKNLADKWNATNNKYQVVINGNDKFNAENAIADIQSGLSSTSNTVYFTVTPGFTSAIESNLLEDMSDVLEMKVDGNEKTIGDKLGCTDYFKQNWLRMESKIDGTGCYALPYACSYSGFVYDHEMFLKYNWLYYADESVQAAAQADGISTKKEGSYLIVTNDTDYYNVGDKLLRAGKDGKYGTYDDGQPISENEWWDMIERIVLEGKKAFLWTGQHDEYMEPLFYSALAQIGGLTKDFEALMGRNSNGQKVKLNDGSETVIDYDNGYLADKLQSLTDALEFMEKIICTSDYVNPKSYSSQTTHTDAQNAFLLGYLNESANPETAMLAEGTWWENEARPFFTALENEGETDRGYGKRDYRYMLLPDIEGQTNKKSCFTTVDVGAMIMAKLSDSEADKAKTKATKEFIAYTLSDENLRYFTKLTGINRAYKYSLSSEDRKEMTRFACTSYDIFHDTENIDIVCSGLIDMPIYKASGYYGMDWLNMHRTAPYMYLVDALRETDGGGAKGMISRLNNRCSPETWATYVSDARKLGLID